MAACAGVARAAGVTFRCVATYAFAAIFGLSLLHSVVSAAVDPEYAYFEPSARWWEFAAGSLAALLVTRPGRGKIADTAGWLGVALIVVCAFGAGPEARFPGWISLLVQRPASPAGFRCYPFWGRVWSWVEREPATGSTWTMPSPGALWSGSAVTPTACICGTGRYSSPTCCAAPTTPFPYPRAWPSWWRRSC